MRWTSAALHPDAAGGPGQPAPSQGHEGRKGSLRAGPSDELIRRAPAPCRLARRRRPCTPACSLAWLLRANLSSATVSPPPASTQPILSSSLPLPPVSAHRPPPLNPPPPLPRPPWQPGRRASATRSPTRTSSVSPSPPFLAGPLVCPSRAAPPPPPQQRMSWLTLRPFLPPRPRASPRSLRPRRLVSPTSFLSSPCISHPPPCPLSPRPAPSSLQPAPSRRRLRPTPPAGRASTSSSSSSSLPLTPSSHRPTPSTNAPAGSPSSARPHRPARSPWVSSRTTTSTLSRSRPRLLPAPRPPGPPRAPAGPTRPTPAPT